MKRTRERRANFKLYADFQLWRRWGPRPPCCSRVKCIWFVAWTKSANIKQCCQQTGCNRKEHKIGHKITYVIWQQTCCLKRRNGTREKRIHVHLWTVVNLSSSFFSNACVLSWASLVAQLVKNLPAMRETWVWSLGLIPGSGRSPGEGNGNPLHDSCLKNFKDRGTWCTTVHGFNWMTNTFTFIDFKTSKKCSVGSKIKITSEKKSIVNAYCLLQ